MDRACLLYTSIENTIAGSLLPNHELLRRSTLTFIGEYKLRISHVLAALPGQRVTDIREVHSHPIALMPVSYTHLDVYKRQILNTWYGGEMKKGMFSYMNYLLPLKGIASMHLSLIHIFPRCCPPSRGRTRSRRPSPTG